MKILIIQLARLGDIYQTWPALTALKRLNPEAEVHLLVRQRFAEATSGLSAVDRLWVLDTKKIVGPVLDDQLPTSMVELDEFLNPLIEQKFDQVVNLTFSPVSSFLTHLLARTGAVSVGYSRFDDGTFDVGDDLCAYFRAQVGIGKPNRFHLTNIFAHILGVEMTESDWCQQIRKERQGIVIHIGASQKIKTVSPEQWVSIINKILKGSEEKIILVGSKNERADAEFIASNVVNPVINSVGKTNLTELRETIEKARLVLGCDSSPMHLAALTDTLCLNLSFSTVNFWETGPKSKDSRVLWWKSPEHLSPQSVADEALAILAGVESNLAVVQSISAVENYQIKNWLDGEFEWRLLGAIYFGLELPIAPNSLFTSAMTQMKNVNDLAVEQLRNIAINPTAQAHFSIIEQADSMITAIGRLVPQALPIVNWYLTEKSRIGPGPFKEVFDKTGAVHEKFGTIVQHYSRINRDLTFQEGHL